MHALLSKLREEDTFGLATFTTEGSVVQPLMRVADLDRGALAESIDGSRWGHLGCLGRHTSAAKRAQTSPSGGTPFIDKMAACRACHADRGASTVSENFGTRECRLWLCAHVGAAENLELPGTGQNHGEPFVLEKHACSAKSRLEASLGTIFISAS